ncbi:MAG: serine hydrolase [Betaproteobacteria bacterium]
MRQSCRQPWSITPRHPLSPGLGLFSQSIDDFLDKTKTTGLLILKDGQVVAERYQYDRRPDMPMRSFSMAKTVTALLIGIAHDKGHITSLDDLAAVYWPEIAGSARCPDPHGITVQILVESLSSSYAWNTHW